MCSRSKRYSSEFFIQIFKHFRAVHAQSTQVSLERSFPPAELNDAKFGQKWTSKVKQRPSLVMGGYGRHIRNQPMVKI